MPIAIENYYFAEVILDITTAPVRFLDKSFAFTKGQKPVKTEGQWYYPIERAKILVDDTTDIPYWPNIVFCQNTDSSRVDMLWFIDGGDPAVLLRQNEAAGLAVRGYDYKEVEKGSILVPNRIEIFRTDAAGVLRERLVKIDYYLLRTTE
ncbi:hypothetical protein ES703_48603 [subsurface metagenome]